MKPSSFGGPKSVTPADFEKQIREQFGAQAEAVLNAYPHATDADAVKAARHVSNDTSFALEHVDLGAGAVEAGQGQGVQLLLQQPCPAGRRLRSWQRRAFPFPDAGMRGTPSEEDLALSDMISSYYVNFAKTGDPNGKGLPQWPAFTDKNQQVMVFDAAPSARTYPLLDKVKVLTGYFDRLRKVQ